MKTLKFYTPLANLILSGDKHTTWRLFDDKDLTTGDKIIFINKDTLETFGEGEILSLYTRTLSTLTDADWEGHERFASDEEMYATYRSYYGDKINEDSEVKIISFTFTANK